MKATIHYRRVSVLGAETLKTMTFDIPQQFSEMGGFIVLLLLKGCEVERVDGWEPAMDHGDDERRRAQGA